MILDILATAFVCTIFLSLALFCSCIDKEKDDYIVI